MKITNIPLRCFINLEKISGKIFYLVEHLSAKADYNAELEILLDLLYR